MASTPAKKRSPKRSKRAGNGHAPGRDFERHPVDAAQGKAPAGPPTRLTEDELSRLGLVVIVAQPDVLDLLPRIVAAHYLRPVARDMHGHVQKLGPAVLATWDVRARRF